MGWKRKKYLSMRILAGVPEVEADPEKRGQLLREGPYAVIRHPRYAEIVFATFGYAALANYLGCWILAVLTLPVLHLVVLMEERELRDRFGEAYREYAARVPRYLPRR
jgi:protein-S-isoprenylcysteine O-methyltransferase Ste14